ncbi:MAG: SDR family oxidoreductase, partial [Xanthobacteraceae bacterium]|nr:SDR family oxidoreductase [Xanthobacteraceae bacterium]
QDLIGKVALITGAARNMGRAFSVALAKRGADIVVHYHDESARTDAEQTAAEIEQSGRRALIVAGDMTDRANIEHLFEAAMQAFGRIDIVINTAGIVIKKPFAAITEEDFDRSFGINAKAAFFIMQEAANRISDNGRIINLGTTLLGATTGYYSVYAGSKAPLEDFTRALAKEIGGRGVTVNTVAPGPVDTSFFHPAETPESTEFLKHMSVQSRLGRIEDIVPMITFLASPEAGWVTAQTLFVNGGFLAR